MNSGVSKVSNNYSQHLISGACALFTVVAMLVNASWAANKEEVLYSFSGSSDGGDPATTLTLDGSGNAYGTTVVGGLGYGTVFKLKHGSGGWVETVLYSFTGGSDGKNPYGGVTLDSTGNLYGTTVAGGTGGMCSGDGCGTVFKLTKSGTRWSESVLYSFRGGNDGYGPGGGVVFDKKGNLYGTTPDGGSHSAGTVYELSPAHGGQRKERVIHAFTGGTDGSTGSLGLLLLDKAGNLYGVAELGGAHGAGTVFGMSRAAGGKWKFSTLYGFQGQPDAGYPYGGLIADAKGNLYGTTYYGGQNGVGSVFQLKHDSGGKYTESVLYSFKTANDGNSPTSTLTFGTGSDLYGTTSSGGDPGCDCGAVFKLTPGSGGGWKESVVHRFKGNPDGAYAYYGVVHDHSGNLYGATAAGGTENQGVLFEMTP